MISRQRNHIYIKNRGGPNTKPCETPMLMSAQEEACPLRGESHIDFRAQFVIMTLAGGWGYG